MEEGVRSVLEKELRRRIRGVATAAAIAALMAGCSSSASTPPSAQATTAAAAQKLTSVQFINPLPQNPQWRKIGDCVKDETEKLGIPFTETGPSGTALDPTTMILQIQQAIAAKKGAIITLPLSDGFTPVLKQAQDAGIVTATMFAGVNGPDSGAYVNIGFNWTKLGALIAKTIADRGGQQVVGLLAAADTGNGKAWLAGFKEAAAGYPNVKVAGEVYTNDEAAKALDATVSLLTAHPDITMLATHMGSATPGMVAAIKEKDSLGKVVFIGNGPTNGGDQALIDGYAYRVFMQPLCGEGRQIVDAVADYANGKQVPFQIDLETPMASKDDFQTYVDQGMG